MKLRILSALLLAGTIITNIACVETIECIQTKTDRLLHKYELWRAKQKICNFVKKHKYKIAAAVGATISVGVAAYCYYHGLPTFLEKIFKKKKCERAMISESDQKLQELQKIMEKVIDNRDKTPQEKYDAVMEYYEHFSKTYAENYEVIDGKLIERATQRFITIEDMQKAHFECVKEFVSKVDTLGLLSSQRDQLISDYRTVDLLSFEKHVQKNNIDKWSSSTINELRFMFIKEFMYHELIKKMKATESKNDVLLENQEIKKVEIKGGNSNEVDNNIIELDKHQEKENTPIDKKQDIQESKKSWTDWFPSII